MFQAQKAEIEFRDSGTGLAYIRVDTVAFMTELNIKDKDFYMDIERIDRDTDKTSFPFTGKCETLVEFEKTLAEYIDWFNKAHENIKVVEDD